MPESRDINCSTNVKFTDGSIVVNTKDRPVILFMYNLPMKSHEGILVTKTGDNPVNLVGQEGVELNGVQIMIMGLKVKSTSFRIFNDGNGKWRVK